MNKTLNKIRWRNIKANLKQFLSVILIMFLSTTLLFGFIVNSNTLESAVDEYDPIVGTQTGILKKSDCRSFITAIAGQTFEQLETILFRQFNNTSAGGGNTGKIIRIGRNQYQLGFHRAIVSHRIDRRTAVSRRNQAG